MDTSMSSVGIIIALIISIIVYFDAKEIGLPNSKAILWTIGTFGLALLFVPLYLIKRPKFKANNSQPENINSAKEDKSNKYKGNIFSWIFSIIFLLATISCFTGNLFANGLLFLTMGLVLFPPFNKFLLEKNNFKIGRKAKALIIMICWLIIIATNNSNSNSNESTTSTNTSEQTATTESTQPTEEKATPQPPQKKFDVVFNTKKYCKNMGNSIGGSYVLEESCTQQESDAKETLASMTIPKKTKKYCKNMAQNIGGSYVLMQSCVEQELNAKNNLE